MIKKKPCIELKKITIATESTKIGEISGTSGVNDTSATSNYIAKLMSLGIIEKEFPYKTGLLQNL